MITAIKTDLLETRNVGCHFHFFQEIFEKYRNRGYNINKSKSSIAARLSNDNDPFRMCPQQKFPKDVCILFPPHESIVGCDVTRVIDSYR